METLMRIAAFLIAFIYPLAVSAQDGELPSSVANEGELSAQEVADSEEEDEEEGILMLPAVQLIGEIERPSVELVLPATEIEFSGPIYPSPIDTSGSDEE